MLKEDSNFAYAKLLAIRQGIWNENDDATRGFAFAFEQALRDEDVEKLGNLALKFGRLEALISVAQALFGDLKAAARIRGVLEGKDEELHPAVRALKRRMGPQLRLIAGGGSPASVIAKDANAVKRALYDANEAALNQFSTAA